MQEVKHIRITDRYVMVTGERKKLAILEIADKLSAKTHNVLFYFLLL
jgi:hypothetical protein